MIKVVWLLAVVLIFDLPAAWAQPEVKQVKDLPKVHSASRRKIKRKRRAKRSRKKAVKPKKQKKAAAVSEKPAEPAAPPTEPAPAAPPKPVQEDVVVLQPETPTKPSIAVMEITASESLDAAVVKLLNERVLARINTNNRFENVIGSSDIQAMLDLEQTRNALGCDDESCLTELGGALGVPYLMVANIGSFAGQFIVNMKVLKVEDGTVGSRVSYCMPNALTIMTGLALPVDQAIELALDPKAVLANNGSNTSVNKCTVPLTQKKTFWAGTGMTTASLLGFAFFNVSNSELQNLKGQYDLARGQDAIDRWTDLEAASQQALITRTAAPLGVAAGAAFLVYAVLAED